MAKSSPMKKFAGILVMSVAGFGIYYFGFRKNVTHADVPVSTMDITMRDVPVDIDADTLAQAGALPPVDEISRDSLNVGTSLSDDAIDPSLDFESIMPQQDAGKSADPNALLKQASREHGAARLATLRRCWTTFQSSPIGNRAAVTYGDTLYNRYVIMEPNRTRWEDIRDAYSVALRGRTLDSKTETEIVHKLDVLNAWLIFSRNAHTNAPASTLHQIEYGESLWTIAKAYGVSHNLIQRLNGINKPSEIRAGQMLRIIQPKRTEVVIDKTRFHLTLYYDGRFIRRFPIGIGKAGKTPVGLFTIKTKDSEPTWWYNNRKIPYGDPRNILGTRWLGFSRSGPGAGLGIHGTRGRSGIGGKESMGCIRMINADVEVLYDLTPINTSVRIMN